MDIFITILVGFIAFLIGVLGFSQVIGSIKYWGMTPLPFLTIAIWVAILALVAAIVHWLLPSHISAFYIAYAIAFVLSLSVRPD